MDILTEPEKEERQRLRLLARKQVMRRVAEYRAEQLSESRELRTSSGFRVSSLASAMDEPATQLDWLWQDRLAAGTVSLLVAKAKVGKSTFARHLAFAVANGFDFLGGAVRKGSVLYLALEEREHHVKTSLLAMGRTGLDNLFVKGSASAQAAIEFVEEIRPALLVIDPLIRLLRLRTENGYAAAYAALGPFIDAAESTGSHILALHHSPKQNRRDPIDLAIGTIGFSGVVSTQLVMRRVGDVRTLQSIQRVGPDLPETILNLDKTSNIFALGSAREDFEEQEMNREMMAVIDACPGITEREIDASIVGRTEKKRGTLRRLKNEGKIKADGGGRRNDPYRYKLAHSRATK